jgi:predicted N-acetyltransferase YhbS
MTFSPGLAGAILWIVDESEIDPDFDAAIRQGLRRSFPADAETFAKTRAWHGSAPDWSVVLWRGPDVIAHAGIVERAVRVGAQSVRVAGVQNVFVLPEHRGQGVFRRVMQVAIREAQRRGLLFCPATLAAAYARLGWRLVEGREVTRVDADGRECPLPGQNVALWHPLAQHALPAGAIHLQGNDW